MPVNTFRHTQFRQKAFYHSKWNQKELLVSVALEREPRIQACLVRKGVRSGVRSEYLQFKQRHKSGGLREHSKLADELGSNT